MSEPTRRQIQALSDEAASHGDLEQVELCERALDGDMAARRECAKAIANAAAQESM